MQQNRNHPVSRQSSEGNNPAAMTTGSFYTPEQHYQQQFSNQQPQQVPGYSITPTFPQSMQTANHQMQVSPLGQITAVPQSQQPGAYQSFGSGQYFVDAACTVPVGQQQPQPLNKFPGLTKQSGGCNNPNCTHCSKSMTAGSPSQRR
ncbi:uncharacterized protein LOC131681772 [Topomyia yanbarensis]|uniref:uncharacterized protein LOC131681772 n=1 Tax=Topomyia yanbarensis TaxID=2498891 RepID=UPI00273C4D8A|nr:uncharacterized protein LOC131681772 [Topomyia yanbarensis]